MKADYPNKANKKKTLYPSLPPQKEVFWNQNKNHNKGKILEQPRNFKYNYVIIKDEQEDQAQIYAALDPSGCNQQFTILKTQGEYEGKPLIFLIDSRSSHSFISPATVKRLQLDSLPIGRKLRVSLANGTTILEEDKVMEIPFQLEGHSTLQKCRILKMGKFQGILGMDWLGHNQDDINCNQGFILFTSRQGDKVTIQGRSGKNPLKEIGRAHV